MQRISTPRGFAVRRVFCGLDSLVDSGRALIEEVEETPEAGEYAGALGYTRLVLHEWLANLVQYANFAERHPCILVQVCLEPGRVRCYILDNSAGFDFHGGVRAQRKLLGALPARGLGLLMITACAEELSYECVRPYRHALSFTVPVKAEPKLPIPFGDEDAALRRASAA